MKKETRQHFNSMLKQHASLNNMDFAAGQSALTFSVEPTIEQKLETKIQESSDFLKKINVQGVDDRSGAKVGLFAGSTIAGRTNTSTAPRKTQDPTGLDDDEYLCRKTDFDTHLTYAKIDAWRKFSDFQLRCRQVVIDQIARDRQMIGFNGTSAAANTDRIANPLLQDVNIGWLEKYRQHKAGLRVESGISIGPGGDYNNLDALVLDAVSSLIEPWYQDSADLKVFVSRSLLGDKYLDLVNTHEQPTERNALGDLIRKKTVGNLPAEQPSFFPSNTIFINVPSNLSIYWQNGSRRRTIKDNPDYDRIEDFQSVNECYEVEDYGTGCLIENITFVS